jgi:hypothetical protein
MKIKNLNGTSPNVCKCGSWLEHWKKFSGQPASHCCELMCTKKPEVGAHIQKDASPDACWYVVPLCSTHNAETGKTMDISDRVVLVSANVTETCGKS